MLLGVATALGLGLRLWFVISLHPPGESLWSDMRGWYEVSRAFADPDHPWNISDTIKPRALGFTGALAFRLFPEHPVHVLGLLQAFLGAATVPLAYVGAARWFSARAALAASFLVATHFVFLNYTGFLLTETYVTFFLALSFSLFVPERPWLSLGSGVALGLATWFKAQAVFLMPLWCLLVISPFGARALGGPEGISPGRKRWTSRHLSALALAVGTLLVIVPESLAVSRLAGKPTFLSTYGGQNFYVGHCPVRLLTCDGGPLGVFNSGVPKVYQRDEPWPDVSFPVPVYDSAFYVRGGMACFTQSGSHASLWLIQQLADVFAGWPGSTIDPWPVSFVWWLRVANLMVAYLFAPIALIGLWVHRRRFEVWFAFGAPIATVLGTALLFSGDPRYREPFDFFIFCAASWTLERWWIGRKHAF